MSKNCKKSTKNLAVDDELYNTELENWKVKV